ncbi:MAG: 23S rRNA (adenine(1618)-N(6))-methyltransferase RlmF [bacterium]|nr:23S rRNA (adenine(1618)-N(6))-methyltransferase RlmF [bacterium]
MPKIPQKPKRGEEKINLHPRNAHRMGYDFEALCLALPALKQFVRPNPYGNMSIDFANPKAVLCLNQALLKSFYHIDNWEIPESYLCPPIPGRVDYIHFMADLLAESNGGKVPTGSKIHGLDIGTGANLIYPMLGNACYQWKFAATETDEIALQNAAKIVKNNPSLEGQVDLRLQADPPQIFNGILSPKDIFDFTLCNPPFHASAEEAFEQSTRKMRNLNPKGDRAPVLNFGGVSHELWVKGGEKVFVKRMILESKHIGSSCFWFSTLISKGSSIDELGSFLREAGVQDLRMVNMSQGQKVSRFIAWTFLNKPQQKEWRKQRWEK